MRSTGSTRAIADGESVDAKKALAHAYAGLDLAYNALGDERRTAYSARSLELYRELGDLVSQGGVLNNLGAIAYFAGRWNDALELYREALAAWEQAGDTRSVSMATFNIGEILSAQGRLDEAEPLLRQAERSSRAAGGASDIAESMLETALLDARRGNVERALAQLAEARRLLAEGGNDSAALLADAREAEALGLGGDYDRAAELAAMALARAIDDEGSALVRPVLHRVLGQAHLLAGRLDDARAALELAIAEANRVEHRYEEALALASLSRLADAPGMRPHAATRSSSSSASSPCRGAGGAGASGREARSGLPPESPSPRASGRTRAGRRCVGRRVRDVRHPERDDRVAGRVD